MKSGQAAYMIDMSVRADDGADFEIMAADNFEDTFDFVAGIDHDCVARRRIAQNRAVALQQPDRQHLVNQFSSHRKPV